MPVASRTRQNKISTTTGTTIQVTIWTDFSCEVLAWRTDWIVHAATASSTVDEAADVDPALTSRDGALL